MTKISILDYKSFIFNLVLLTVDFVFLRLNLVFLGLHLLFLGLDLAFLRLDLPFLRLDLPFLRLDLAFLRLNLLFLRLDLAFLGLDLAFLGLDLLLLRLDLVLLRLYLVFLSFSIVVLPSGFQILWTSKMHALAWEIWNRNNWNEKEYDKLNFHFLAIYQKTFNNYWTFFVKLNLFYFVLLASSSATARILSGGKHIATRKDSCGSGEKISLSTPFSQET